MQGWHRSGLNAAFESVAHYQAKVLSQFSDKRAEFGKVVTVVGIANDDVLTARGDNTPPQGITISFFLNIDDAGTQFGCDSLRSIRATVISNNNFTSNIQLLQRAFRFLYTDWQRFRLIETRHHDRQFQFGVLSFSFNLMLQNEGTCHYGRSVLCI